MNHKQKYPMNHTNNYKNKGLSANGKVFYEILLIPGMTNTLNLNKIGPFNIKSCFKYNTIYTLKSVRKMKN